MEIKHISPEHAGVMSQNITKYIEKLEEYGLATHDLIFAKGNEIFFEKYWKPFDKSFLHRMYSVSKSFVAVAAGFAIQDGYFSLDDKIVDYFKEYPMDGMDKNFNNLTIREMLMMSTARPERCSWFKERTDDRVKIYFNKYSSLSKPGGTIFEYDSPGSFVVGALIEKLSGMELMEYLRIKLFDKIGVSKEVYCLKCPGGHSWGDSAVLCTPIDLYKIALFMMNNGKWGDEQILNEEYCKTATSRLEDNNSNGMVSCSSFGYGYYIWRTYDNSFFFNGMGCQFAVCVPDKNMIMIYNGDNQGNSLAGEIIIKSFFDYIVRPASESEIPENKEDIKDLEEKTSNLELVAAKGCETSEFAKEINGIKYIADENPMGIEWFKITLSGDEGVFEYKNAQGEKKIKFGMCKNVYGVFPQEGYSDIIGSETAPGNMYKCAASAAWVEKTKLFIKVQIIDKYFGNLGITIGFKGDEFGMQMFKAAEDFLDEYEGYAGGCKA